MPASGALPAASTRFWRQRDALNFDPVPRSGPVLRSAERPQGRSPVADVVVERSVVSVGVRDPGEKILQLMVGQTAGKCVKKSQQGALVESCVAGDRGTADISGYPAWAPTLQIDPKATCYHAFCATAALKSPTRI